MPRSTFHRAAAFALLVIALLIPLDNLRGATKPKTTRPARTPSTRAARPSKSKGPAPTHAAPGAIDNEQITAGIQGAIDYLYKKQNDTGTWEATKKPATPEKLTADTIPYGGLTALTLHALLEAGENPREPRLAKAIDFLMNDAAIDSVYAIGLRAQCWPKLPAEKVKSAMLRDRFGLINALHRGGSNKGFYSRLINFQKDKVDAVIADYNASVAGVLGVKALADAGMEIPNEYWDAVDKAWRAQQLPDGSWEDHTDGKTQSATMNMSAAGVAVLFSAIDELAAAHPGECLGAPVDSNIENGLKWIDDHFSLARESFTLDSFKLANYAYYSLERVGVTGGRKYFRNRDWYQDGARQLLDAKAKDGSWSNIPDTDFGILFLARGRNPIAVNKLQYDVMSSSADATAGTAKPANWNERPRDVGNVTNWIGQQVEAEFNWQSVSLSKGAADLHDSQLLYMSGNQVLNLTSQDKARLKQFIDQGGIVIGNADCESKDFSSSFKSLGQELYPSYEFRAVPRDNVLYTGEQFRAAKWKNMPELLELNNGVRDLMFLMPTQDPARAFQLHQIGVKAEQFQLFSDIIYYSVDQDGMRLKGSTYIVSPDAKVKPSATIKIGRLQYAGNWNPEPGGWERISAVMLNSRKLKLDVVPVTAGQGQLDQSIRLLDMTGTAAFHLSAEAEEDIRQYVKNGGTLLVDAAGGAGAFDTTAQAELKTLFSDNELDILQYDHPIYNGQDKIPNVSYRRFARNRMGEEAGFRLKGASVGERTAIYYSAEDLSEGLVGQSVDGIYGYDPAVATQIVCNLIESLAK